MRVVIEDDQPCRRVNVYLIRDGNNIGSGWAATLQPDGVVHWVEANFGTTPPAFLRLPQDVFAALMQEGIGHVPESAVMERAWVDSMAVRDRALALVERLVP